MHELSEPVIQLVKVALFKRAATEQVRAANVTRDVSPHLSRAAYSVARIQPPLILQIPYDYGSYNLVSTAHFKKHVSNTL